MNKVVQYIPGIKVYYAGMGSDENNTHTKNEVKQLITQWPENKIMLQYGFSYKGARPHPAASREEAIKHGFFDAHTDNDGNLVLIEYSDNDMW